MAPRIIPVLIATPIAAGLVIAYPSFMHLLYAVAALTALVYGSVLHSELTVPFGNLPGPKAPSAIWGVLKGIIAAPPNALHEEWFAKYGPTIRYRVLLGDQRICSVDPGFLQYILQHSDDFIKPEHANRALQNLLGDGLLTAEGGVHRRQRRVINPAFGPAAIRGMESIFWDKTYELQQKLLGFYDEDNREETSPTPPKPQDQVKGAIKIDVQKYLAQGTLDVIGVAGFNYDFGALNQETSELAEAFREMFSVGQRITPLAVLEAFIPIFRVIPTKRRRVVADSRARCEAVARRLISEKKRLLTSGGDDDTGKDLLSLLMRANMSPDLRPDQKLTDEEVMAQITTFMLAGNETSSTALTWLLYRLAQHPEMQKRLRDECLAVDDARPSLATVEALPYLDKVIHEILRFDNPVPGTVRMARGESVVPLSQPVKGRDGKMVDSVRITKGHEIFIPIMNVNKSEEIWGEDAKIFNPDRFDVGGIPKKSVPGVYGNLLTFLGGARNCIGYRFALAEMKIMTFVLMRTFSFEELPSKPVIEQKSSIVMRPRVVGEEDAGLQMPLLMRPLPAE